MMADSTTYEPAEVTVGRAQRFFAILCDLGLDDAYDKAEAQQREETRGTPQSIADVAEQQEEAVTVRINKNDLTKALMLEGRLAQMAEVVIDLPPDVDAEDVPVKAVADALGPFILAYAQLIGVLLGTAGATASA